VTVTLAVATAGRSLDRLGVTWPAAVTVNEAGKKLNTAPPG